VHTCTAVGANFENFENKDDFECFILQDGAIYGKQNVK
jgi:hypothetical protein